MGGGNNKSTLKFSILCLYSRVKRGWEEGGRGGGKGGNKDRREGTVREAVMLREGEREE